VDKAIPLFPEREWNGCNDHARMALNEVRFPEQRHREGWSEERKNMRPEFEEGSYWSQLALIR
jgi:hypothetical protein